MAHPFTPLPEGLLCLPVQLSVQEIAGDRPVHPGEVEGTVGEQQRHFLHRPHSASHRYPDSCKVPDWDPQIQGHSLCWCSGCWGLTHYSVMFWVEECTLDCDLTFYTLILSVIVNLVIFSLNGRHCTIREFFSDGIFHLARSEMCGLRAPFTFGTSQLFWLQLSIIPPGARVRARQTWKEIFVIADEQLYLMRVPDIFWILFFCLWQWHTSEHFMTTRARQTRSSPFLRERWFASSAVTPRQTMDSGRGSSMDESASSLLCWSKIWPRTGRAVEREQEMYRFVDAQWYRGNLAYHGFREFPGYSSGC